jgi:hypothetical protein
MAPSTAARPRANRRWILPGLDAVALLAFTLVGVANHDHGLPADALARVGGPLLVAWFVATWVVGTYRSPGIRSLLLAWVIAVPVAGVVRTLIAGGPWGGELLVFLAVAMAFTLLFLLLGRGLALALRLDGRVVDWRVMPADERGPDAGTPDVELPEFDEFHRLLVSVEELRALLAPLSDTDRQRVLDLARSLHPRHDTTS